MFEKVEKVLVKVQRECKKKKKPAGGVTILSYRDFTVVPIVIICAELQNHQLNEYRKNIYMQFFLYELLLGKIPLDRELQFIVIVEYRETNKTTLIKNK